MTILTEPYLGRDATGIPVSNSEVEKFKSCRRLWWLTHYLGLGREQSKIGPLPLGTRVHLALEGLYRDGRDPVEVYQEHLEEDRILFNDSDESTNDDAVKKFNSEGELGRIMVEGYMDWLEDTHADSLIEVIDTEKEVRYPLFDGKIILRGKVDMRVRDRNDGARLALDHKTAVSFNVYHNNAHMSEQLMTYTLLEKLQGVEFSPVEGGIYNLLKKVRRTAKATPPFYERIVVRFNDKTLESFWTRLHGTLRDMLRVREELDRGVDHRYVAYPSPTKDCSWKCPFFSACYMFDDGSSIEGWISNNAQKIDPYARYETEDEG